jgi:predicted outer membrane repeat protein
MDATRFDCFVVSFVTSSSRRGLSRLLGALSAAPSRRAALRVLSGLGLAGLVSQTEAKKKKSKKKCAKAGETTRKKRKKCCAGLDKDATGRCAVAPPLPCVSACPANACGSVPDGCGGTLTCGCPANHLCLRSGVCQPCTVTCTGPSMQCGTALQAALNGGGTLYVCPGRYVGNFTIPTAVSVIGAGEGTDTVSDTILDVGGTGRGLVINPGVGLVELDRLRFTDSNTATGGGGITHAGTTLRMTECTVSGNANTNVNSFGGGIFVGADSMLEMTRCTVRDNHAGGLVDHGGGIFTAGITTLTDCLVEDNSAIGQGGGISVFSGARAILAGSTQVRGNTAGDRGGGIFVNGLLIISETCRVAENTANGPGGGGGIYNDSAAVTLQGPDPSPIVVNNCHENCVGTVSKCATTPVSC